jgi:hypothetical protein
MYKYDDLMPPLTSILAKTTQGQKVEGSKGRIAEPKSKTKEKNIILQTPLAQTWLFELRGWLVR